MTAPARASAVLFPLLLLIVSSCGPSAEPGSQPDDQAETRYGAVVFALNDSTEVVIPGERSSSGLILRNGEEQLELRPGSPGCFSLPVFDGSLCLEGDSGQWTDAMRVGDTPYTVPVTWHPSASPAKTADGPVDTLDWRLTFGTDDPWYGNLHLRTTAEGHATGTIGTATGDFRYLHGEISNGRLQVQTFDGAHLFLFVANVRDDQTLESGTFYSGTHYSTPFTGSPLTPDNTPLSEGQLAQWTGQDVGYSGRNAAGDSVAWGWDADSDTTHILSVMGTWCPNCMDEHRMLLDLVNERPDVVVHTLAFERGLDRPNGEEAALERLRNYASNMGLSPVADRWRLTLVGPASKTQAQQRLPFLDRVVSFPTSVILTPGSTEPWIHSGFNGPATGGLHDLERAAFSSALSGPLGSH